MRGPIVSTILYAMREANGRAPGDRVTVNQPTSLSAGRRLDFFATVLMIGVALAFVGMAAYSYLSSPRRETKAVELPVPSQPISLEGATVRGCESSTVAVIEYADFQCPACGTFARNEAPGFFKRFVATCKVKFAFRNVPVAATHGFAVEAAEVAACAGRQGRFWEAYELLYQSPATLAANELRQVAADVGVDDKIAYEHCLTEHATLAQIRLDAGEGITMGLSGTPTFLIGPIESGGQVRIVRRLSGAVIAQRLEEVVENLLSSSK